jgi:acyl-coenzyme A thioesterase PaaI-like protein
VTDGPDDVRRAAAAMRRLTTWLVAGDRDGNDPAELADALESLAAGLPEVTATSRYDGPIVNADDPRGQEAAPYTGLANPVSPPVVIELVDGVSWGRGRFGPAYEGPPGAVHGGYVAGVFDVVLGMAAREASGGAVTGELTIRYHRPTPLGEDLVFKGWVDSSDGRHVKVVGQLHAFDDFLTAEAEARFVVTRRPGFGRVAR